jgi:diguanylate cyclase (GGDEF)-like protein
VNDRLGHLQGNKLLQSFSMGLKDAGREYDYAARMGGDEFVIVMPGLKEDRTAEIIQRLQAIIAQAGRGVCAEEVVSGSIGHAFYPADGSSAEELLAEADRRMYQVKSSHRPSAIEDRAAARAAQVGK